ncbi:MAG TPA: MFS transporter [Usitatibacter sp.]|nr:MFS transporter [Usitatibacter sp.]
MRPFLLLWLFGLCLRTTVLAVPPVIPLIHQSLALSQAQVGALANLPVLLLSFAAIPGSILIARFGAFAVLLGGILLTGLGSALRGASFDAATLFATTFVMGVGIAIMQPALPSVVRQWVPQRIALGTAVYSNGLLMGEALAASLTIPVVLPLVGHDWRLALVAWSVPIFAIAVAGWLDRRGEPREVIHEKAKVWWPDWKSPVTWRLGLISGGCSSIYFTTNAFLPDFLHRLGRGDLLGPALSANNWLQIPASLALLFFSRQLMMKRWPFVAMGITFTLATVGLVLSRDASVVFYSGVIGFCSAFVLTSTLALPPMLVDPHDVPRVAAAMFAIGYLCAIVTPVIGGFLWDVTGLAWLAFLPAGLFGPLMVVMAAGLRLEPHSP